MNVIIDCIKSLGDMLMVLSMWFGAAGLMWLHDEVKARKKAPENVSVEART